MWKILVWVGCLHLASADDADRPVIRASDGDLILRPARGRSVIVATNGPGSSLYVDSVDVTKLLNTTPANVVPSSDTSILERIDNLERYLRMNLNITSNYTSDSDVKSRLRNLDIAVTLLTMRFRRWESRVLEDFCGLSPCQHGGTCLRTLDGRQCLCPQGWEGTDCGEDIDECTRLSGTELGCQNGATCTNVPGGYECVCASGWFGTRCTLKERNCNGTDTEICGHGACVPTVSGSGVRCLCDAGWTNNGAIDQPCTRDVDECSERTPHCSVSPRVACVNLPGSFTCAACPTGFSGDGFACYDIDECETDNGGCSTTPRVSCHNTIGSRLCGGCPPGYAGDGVTCLLRSSCSIRHGGCHPSATCVQNLAIGVQFSQCQCPPGMRGDGVGPDGCFIPSNKTNSSDCNDGPCVNGRCRQLAEGFTCDCDRGYTGAMCDTLRDYCSDNPCKNGGICRAENSTLGYRCECTALYAGNRCQRRARSCNAIYTTTTGNILYPTHNTTATYNHNARCFWVIRVPDDKVINITFSKFNLEFSNPCSFDFLQINDGPTAGSQPIGRFCGDIPPRGGQLVSSHNALYLWFKSDASVAHEGFALHWESIDPMCGGEVDARTHGAFSSPGWPGRYPANRDCYWHLTAGGGYKIQLNFFSIALETHPNCSFDSLSIYEGSNVADALLARYCNTSQPAPLISSGAELLIHFHSDSLNNDAGFQISYAPVAATPGCGGQFTADRAEISSPTYDGSYLSDLTCDYEIRVKNDMKIRLTVIAFDLEGSRDCNYDYLSIYDGPSSGSKLIGKFCGTMIPHQFTSSSNRLFIRFKTDSSYSKEGFKIKYELFCHSVLNSNEGIITSPGYPGLYPGDFTCDYIINTAPGTIINLSFVDFDFETDYSRNSCPYDRLEISDGLRTSNLSQTRILCGKHIPQSITSLYNFLHLQFFSDLSISGRGFKANYSTETVACGGVYTASNGTISHPASENDYYEESQNCKWIILAPVGNIITITWNRFNIALWNRNCIGDYVKLYENVNGKEMSYGPYCGQDFPPALSSVNNKLTIEFKSNVIFLRNYNGFSISYQTINEGNVCGGNFLSERGYIRSPGWPERYFHGKDCVWVIKTPPGQQIYVNVSKFSLENTVSCRLDYLELRNGPLSNSPLIGKYCGTTIPRQFSTHANSLYVHFHSDGDTNDIGFDIEWDSSATGCGGTLTGSSGSISSPNYPQPYDEDAECFWRIIVNAGSIIRINFVEIDLEDTENCFSDYVELYDGKDNNSPILGTFCSQTPKTANIVTRSNYIFIKFRSDVSEQGKGFLLNYYADCYTTSTGTSGVIESPDFPNGLPRHTDCLWNINVPKGNTINATFTHFNILQRRLFHFMGWNIFRNLSCTVSYVQIKDTSDFGPPLCGHSIPNKITTRGNTLAVKLISELLHSTISSSGFRLEWVIDGCGGHIKKESGTITPPPHRAGVEDPTECEWLIETEPGKSINIQIYDVNLIHSDNCTIDSIELYNGENAQSPLITRICDRNNNFMQQAASTSNYLFFKFTSTSRFSGSNFRAVFTSTPDKCGGVLILPSGTISSPNYPKNYDKNANCIWYITVPQGHRVRLEFDDLDLFYNGKNCTDYVKISDRILEPEKYIMNICEKNTINETAIISTSNFMKVQFISGTLTAKGFKAYFSTICGSEIKAKEDGYLNVLNTHFGKEHNCTWTILANEPEQKISITITYIDIPMSGNNSSRRHCPSEFLRILDGNDQEAPVAGEYCGRRVPKMFISHGSAVVLQLGSYGTKITGHFSARYSLIQSNCGGTLTSLEGTIVSPGYPYSYLPGVECIWNILVSSGNSLSLVFESFKIASSEHCNEEYLEVRKDDDGGKLLGVYCGDRVPSVVSSSLSPFYVKFHSDKDGTGNGFQAYYTYETHVDIVDLNSGTVSSPLYPIEYRGAGQYSWRITGSTNSYIAITIITMQIDVRGRSCYNYLAIYDGYDNTAPLIKQLCGLLNSKDADFHSTSNIVYIELFLDDSNEKSEFVFNWMKVDKSLVTEEEHTSRKCSSNNTFVSSYRPIELKSPNYPQNYENDLNCEWIYETSSDRHLQLTFRDIDIEEGEDCNFDYVAVYSGVVGTNDWQPISHKLCYQSKRLSLYETTNLMKIKFVSDAFTTKRGFLAEINSRCGGTVTDPAGSLEIQQQDLVRRSQFQTKINCNWTLIAKPGKTIAIRFEMFNASTRADNCANYVSFKNGIDMDSPPLGNVRYCINNTQMVEPLETTSNNMYIIFTSTDIRAFNKLRLHYEERSVDCGSSSRLDTTIKWQIIQTLNYPEPPLPNSECIWTFIAPIGETIRLDFIERFDLYHSSSVADCSDEFIEVMDGLTSSSTPLGRLCDEKQLKTIKSTANAIYIRYVTNRLTPNNGFKANVSINLCGGTLRGSSGKITSPGYPMYSVLPPNTVCEWRIIGSLSRPLWINVEDVNLPETHLGESITKVVIEDVLPSNKSNVVNKIYQGRWHKDVIRSKYDEVVVKFYYNKPTKGVSLSRFKGFKLSFNSSGLQCGGNLNSRSGYIDIPEYSTSHTEFTYCIWRITTPDSSRRIRLEILSTGTSYYTLMIYHDRNYGALLHSDYPHRHNDSMRVFESSANAMTVTLWSGSSRALINFRARYSSDQPALCGGESTDLGGQIISPKIGQNMSYFCQWTLSRDISEESSQLNTTYYLKVNATSIGWKSNVFRMGMAIVIKEVGFTSQKSIHSDGIKEYRIPATAIKIEAYKHSNSVFEFDINWKANPCGGKIVMTDNVVDILNLPTIHNGSLDCSWYVRKKPGLQIKLNIEGSFSLSCLNEYIKVSPSESLSPGVDVDFCRDRPDKSLQVNYQSFYIHYHSDSFINSTLKLQGIIQASKSCGEKLTDQSLFSARILRTPNYPQIYGDNQECIWDISTTEGNVVSLWFEGRFYIEDTVNCTKDYVLILDWKNDKFEETNRLCGRQRPQIPYNSTNNKMRIIFRSDASINADGFQARWKTKCGGKFTASEKQQFIYSSNYPHQYYSNVDCKYTILAKHSGKIYVKFLAFNLESGTQIGKCDHDNVTITNYPYSYKGDTNIFCGKISPPPKTYDNGVDITFRTDSTIGGFGFQIMYKLYSCGGNITTHTTINSGNEDDYDDDEFCQWNITAPLNKVVVIRFEKLQLEKSHNCIFDSVQIFNSTDIYKENQIAVLCGDFNKSLPTFRSSGRNMVVIFTTDSSRNSKGFAAKIYFSYGEQVGCGGNIVLENSTIIKSPMLPGAFIYEKYLECHWMIQAPADQVIRIEFKRFNVAPCDGVNQTALGYSRCTCDFIRVYDGASTLNDLLATYCGHTIPPTITSSREVVLLTFYSDGETESRGFEASVSAVNTECGQRQFTIGTVDNTVQHIRSPRYGLDDLPRGLRCVYHVLPTNSEDEIHVRVNNIDLEPANANHHCETDRVVISSYARHHNMSLGPDFIVNGDDFYESSMPEYMTDFLREKATSTLCGEEALVNLHVYDSVTITLITTPNEVTRKHKGFDIEVSTETDCIKNISDIYGSVKRKMRSATEDCYVLITAPVNSTISLYFYAVSLSDDSKLEIYDGSDKRSPLLTRLTITTGDDIAVFSSGRYLLLREVDSDSNSIYELNYITTDKGRGCGGNLHAVAGSLSSPFYPEPSRAVRSCTWELRSPPQTELKLTFVNFDLGQRSLCTQIYLQLIDQAGAIRQYCADDDPADFSSPDGYVKLVYYTTMNAGGPGWLLHFAAVPSSPGV